MIKPFQEERVVMSPKLEKFAPLSGVVFLILMAVVILALSNDSPDLDDSAGRILAYWRDHKNQQLVAGLLGGLASIALIWFGGSLRKAIDGVGGGSRLGGLALVGAAVAGAGGLLISNMAFVTADSIGKVPAEATLTLNALCAELFLPLTGGMFVMLAATALATLYWGILPKWFGWVTAVIALVMLTPVGFIGFLATILWAGVVGVWLFVRTR